MKSNVIGWKIGVINLSVKLIANAVAGVAALALPAVVFAAGPVSHFNGSGGTATASFSDGTTTTNLTINQNGTGATATNYLNLYTSACSYSSTSYNCSGVTLYGNFPGSDFAVNGRNAVLNTTGSTLSGVTFSYGCDFTTWNCTWNQTPISGAPISLKWKQSSEYNFHISGTQVQDYLNYETVTNGTTDYNTAIVSGTILGAAFSGSGSLGSSKNVSITVTQLH